VRPRGERAGEKEYAAGVAAVRDGRFADAVRELASACQQGFPAAAILADPKLWPLREDPERRLELSALLKAHARACEVQIVDPCEPGARIRLAGRVVDAKSGAPLAGALVHLFHTDARGEYRPGMDAGGGAGNPRLFGWVRSDADGRFIADTIMPERYPNSTVPRHVHYRVQVAGHPELVSECFFADDPNLGERRRSTAAERGFPIVGCSPASRRAASARCSCGCPGSDLRFTLR
jgi:hypothetical protein